MTTPDRSLPQLDRLLAHRAWVRAVARRLVRDEQAADDLAQEAWVRAVRTPPDPARDPRPWFRRVLRNLASNTRRGEGRRRHHETAGAAPAPHGTRSPAELVAEAEQHRRIVGHVLDLEEPFRTVLVLRYFEGLRPPEIARRTDAAVGTVHSRLHRAITRLKARLDAEAGGDRRAWIAGLLPMTHGLEHAGPGLASQGAVASAAAASTGVGMAIAHTKLAWGLAALLVLLVGGGILYRLDPGGDPVEATDSTLRSADGKRAEPTLTAQGTPARSADAAPTHATDPTSTEPRASAAGTTWRGVVRDVEGRAVHGAMVFVLPGSAVGIDHEQVKEPRFGKVATGADGRFALTQGAVRSPRLVAWSGGHLAASLSLVGRDPSEPILLTLGARRLIRVTLDRQAYEGDLPLAVTIQTRGEEHGLAVDPAEQAIWVQSAEATARPGIIEHTMRVNTTAPVAVTFEAPRGFTTLPREHVLEGEADACAFRVVPSATIRYRLLDATTGEPIPATTRCRFFLYERGSRDVVASMSSVPPRFEVTSHLRPGAYDYELRADGYALVRGSLTVKAPGEVLTGSLRLQPELEDETGRLVIGITPARDVPEAIRALAVHEATSVLQTGYVVFLKRRGADAWVGTSVLNRGDGTIVVEPGPALSAERPRLPDGVYDIVVVRNGHGTAAAHHGVRLFAHQENRLDVALAPGTFVRLAEVTDPDSALVGLEVRSPSLPEVGGLPLVAFHGWGQNTWFDADEVRRLVAPPRAARLLGPFPGAGVDVVLTTSDGTTQTVRVRGAAQVVR